MVEYPNHFFSETMTAEAAIQKAIEAFDKQEKIVALHFGTDEQLEAKRQEATIDEKIRQLQEQVDELYDSQLKSELIDIPTKYEIKKYGGE